MGFLEKYCAILHEEVWRSVMLRCETSVAFTVTAHGEYYFQEEFEKEQEHFRSVSYLSSAEQKNFKDKQQIAFMYMKPPGLDAALSREKEQNDNCTQKESKPVRPLHIGQKLGASSPYTSMVRAQLNQFISL